MASGKGAKGLEEGTKMTNNWKFVEIVKGAKRHPSEECRPRYSFTAPHICLKIADWQREV